MTLMSGLTHMRRLVLIVGLCVLGAGCDAKRPVAVEKPSPMVTVPPFQIRITISDAAAKKLRDAHESVKGTVYFDGDGASKLGEITAPFRAVYLGSYEFEIAEAGTISITSAKVAEEAVRRLSNADYYYTVNVYSGRRAFPNNVLDGGVAIRAIACDALIVDVRRLFGLRPPWVVDKTVLCSRGHAF